MNEEHGHKSVTILALAMLGFGLFQMSQILVDRGALGKVKEQMETNLAQADKVLAENKKMLDQLNVIAIGTQKLADSGNSNAKDIVTQLNRLGIKINPNFKAGEPPPPVGAPPGAPPPPPEAPPK